MNHTIQTQFEAALNDLQRLLAQIPDHTGVAGVIVVTRTPEPGEPDPTQPGFVAQTGALPGRTLQTLADSLGSREWHGPAEERLAALGALARFGLALSPHLVGGRPELTCAKEQLATLVGALQAVGKASRA